MKIFRSWFLVNKSRRHRIIRKQAKNGNCNHCGGAFRNSGDMTACIMCSRVMGHICENCSHATTESVEKKQETGLTDY